MIKIDAVDLMVNDVILDSRNNTHTVVERVGNVDEEIASGIAFNVRTGRYVFTEIYSRHERLNVERIKAAKHIDVVS